MDSRVFDALWTAYQVRRRIEAIDSYHEGLVLALHANGNLGGEALSQEVSNLHEKRIESINLVLDAADKRPHEIEDPEFEQEIWW